MRCPSQQARNKPRPAKASAANDLHQSRRIILNDIDFRPNSSDGSIEARPMIDIEPRCAFSLEMDPLEYCVIKKGIITKLGYEQQPKSPRKKVNSNGAFEASV